jgi:uncharacterized oxidoreductase
MELSKNTILVTGGASGIGLALALRFASANNTVIICGRREDKLAEAQKLNPQLHTKVCSLAQEKNRLELFSWVTKNFPDLNILVNNAGIQRRVNFLEPEPWETTREEISVNLEAPIHLSRIFIPHLLQQNKPAIINVTSGLSFAPLAPVPVYCATKAALHSFTLSLRHQLSKTPVKIIEIIPPAVNTDLGGPGLHTFGVPLDEFADSVFNRLKTGASEIAYGTAEKASRSSREDLDNIFHRMNPS